MTQLDYLTLVLVIVALVLRLPLVPLIVGIGGATACVGALVMLGGMRRKR